MIVDNIAAVGKGQISPAVMEDVHANVQPGETKSVIMKKVEQGE